MTSRARLLIILSASTLAAVLSLGPVSASSSTALTYAVKGAKIVTMAGATIESGTIVMRDGVIVDVGASVTAPADAIVIDGAGLTVYPGLIDMGNDAPIDTGEPDPAAGGGGRGGGGGGGRGGAPAGPTFATLEEAERVKRASILRPDFRAADNLRTSSAELAQLASAGVTTVLAVPASGIFKGQSALVNVAVPADDPQISTIADYRKGLGVVRAPVASHVNPAGRGGGQGYPQSLLGTVAFTRQGFLDAQWQQAAKTHYTQKGGPRPVVEPALDALQPALARQIPVAFDASEAREIDRVLAIAAEFGLDPIVMGADNAAERTAELAKAKARVIYNLNLPGRGGGAGGGGGGGGGGRGGGGAPSLRLMKLQADAPKVPAVLAKAGVPFAFTSNGATPGQFVQNAGRVSKEGGLAPDATLRALTIDAARLAGAADRIGSLERGKIANIVAVKGDILDGGAVTHVFIDGRPVDLTPPPTTGTGRGRGGF